MKDGSDTHDVTEVWHGNGKRTILVTDALGLPTYMGPDRRERPVDSPDIERRTSQRLWQTGPGLKAAS